MLELLDHAMYIFKTIRFDFISDRKIFLIEFK